VTDARDVQGWLETAAKVVGLVDPSSVAAAVDALAAVRQAGGTIFVAGNGGSASTASHLALDLQKAARTNGGFSRAVSLSDSVGLITAWANDESFERVFAEQLEALARRGDALVVFSVSGSSPNLIAAFVLEHVITYALCARHTGASARVAGTRG
jgi:D-sedoheptulose 7-phosphate isomerase